MHLKDKPRQNYTFQRKKKCFMEESWRLEINNTWRGSKEGQVDASWYKQKIKTGIWYGFIIYEGNKI